MELNNFLRPTRLKLILFIAVFIFIFFKLPFVKMSTGETNSFFWLVKGYSGSKLELSMVISGFIIYFITSYFISCLSSVMLSSFKFKK